MTKLTAKLKGQLLNRITLVGDFAFLTGKYDIVRKVDAIKDEIADNKNWQPLIDQVDELEAELRKVE